MRPGAKAGRSTTARSTSAVAIFIGVILIVIFVIGILANRDPGMFMRKYRYDYALEQFVMFCRNWWLPAGIIGIPVFLVSLIRSLILESRESKQQNP